MGLGGVVLIGLWIGSDLLSRNPLFDLSLMRERPVWTTNVFALMIGAGMYGAFAAYPILAQLPEPTGYGASVMRTGVYLLPVVAPMGLATLVATYLTNTFGASRVLVAGSVITAGGFASMAIWNDRPLDMIISLALAGTGLGLILTTLFTVVVHAVPGPQVGEVSGMNSVIRFVGGAVGTQVVSALVSNNTEDGLPVMHGFVLSFTALAVCMLIAVVSGVLVSTGHDEA